MSNEEKLEAAKQYVDKQLETMRKYGSAPKELSENEYRALVEDVIETLDTK